MTKEQKEELKEYVEQIQQETKTGPGRSTMLSWEMLAHIKALLYEGQFQKYVFQSLGIAKTTWDDWARKGRAIAMSIQEKKRKFDKLKAPEKKYLALAAYIDRGKAKAIVKHQSNIVAASKTDWKASRWFLEMQDRETFGQKIQAEVTNVVTMDDLLDEIDDE